MREVLNKVIKWLEDNSPETLEHVNGPASNSDIERIENEINISLPDDYKEFLKIHDGEDAQTWLAMLGNGNQLLSSKAILEQYKLEQEVGKEIYDEEMETIEFWKDRVKNNIIFIKGNVKPLILHTKWLPITSMNGDVIRYLDFEPAPGGVPGQVIEVDQEACCHQVIASNFKELITNYMENLYNNKFEVDEDGYLESQIESELDWNVPEWLLKA